jgi:hypothetical protein
MIKKIYPYIFLFSFYQPITSAQEVITGLQSNINITKSIENKQKTKSAYASGPLQLPFFDDFSENSVFPNDNKWMDGFVYINNTFSDKQITRGIATFDALNSSGRLYETSGSSVFKADQLTSYPVNLSYPASENIWFSFFYQSGGLGDVPEKNDSLTLQFLAPDENKWYSVWRAKGNTYQKFKAVILKIDHTRFLKNGFKFRFTNYASLSPNLIDPSMVGNCDMWNIDYVFLDKNRDGADTVFADVALTLPIRSALKTHEAMPWKQFREVELQEMGSSIPIHYRNNDIIIRNVTRNFEIWDVYRNSLSESFSAGATNIAPLTDVFYNANLIYTFNTNNEDSALFRITCSLKTDAFDPKDNDTLVYYQRFSNYFAFDDGSAEAGYGINGLGSRNAMLAYRFVSYTEDTLRAIKICFNDSYLDANKRAFDIMVWDDNKGIPGNVIYSLEEVMVEQGSGNNGFYNYILPEGVKVKDKFYVGWKQRSETFLNAGYDVNTPHDGKQFFWINGEWRESQVTGSVMIRPVVGNALKTTSIDDIYYGKNKKINIWPNPAKDYIAIDPGDVLLTGLSYITVIDLNGREVMKVPFSERIDISALRAGMYIILTSVNGGVIGYNRVIKTK